MVAPPALNRLPVGEAVRRYLANVNRAVRGHSLSATTARNYERDLREFVELVGTERVLDDLTPDEIDDVVLAYGDKPDGRYTKPRKGNRRQVKTRGVGAQARFRQSVSRLFGEATLDGWVQANPMPRTKVKPKMRGLTNVARKALPQSAAEALITVPAIRVSTPDKADRQRRSDMRQELRDEFLLRLLMETGPRVQEVSDADRADLEHRDDGTTWLRLTGKGNKTRWVPVSPETAAVYADYLEHERSAPHARIRTATDPDTGETYTYEVDTVDDADRALVLTWRGLRMKPRDIQYMVERACKALPPEVRRSVTPHGLRHTAATLLLVAGGADVKTVQEILGHASVATTGFYLDTVDTAMAAAVRDHPVTGRRTRPAALAG